MYSPLHPCVLVSVFLAVGHVGQEDGTSARGPHSIDAALARAGAILLERQESFDGAEVAGEWPYEGVYREGGEIPPGYRVGGTAICAWALSEAPGYEESSDRREAVARATERILALLALEPMA